MSNLIKYLIFFNLLCFTSVDANITQANKIKTLTLTTIQTHFIREKESDIHLYSPVEAPLKVIATYEDGKSEEVTDMVTWESNISGLSVNKYGVQLVEGDFRITTSLDSVTSNSIMIKVEDDDKVPKFLRVKIRNSNDESYPNRNTTIKLALVHKPTEDVKVKLTLKESDNMRFYTYESGGALTKEITFSPSEYRHYLPENIYVLEHNIEIIDQDTNNTNPYTVEVETLESLDAFFDSKDPTDIVVEKQKFSIIEPPLQQRRGAIRGVTIMFQLLSHGRGVKYTLVSPPEGMKIIEESNLGMTETLSGVDVEWKVPMDAEEGQIYNITARATEIDGTVAELTFPIKVPKTKPIQTKLVNNELIVTDKSSPLYGMKMKGHSGEDIYEMRLKSVEYGDVWKERIENRKAEDVIEYTMFILDNMPNALDIKMPEWMDTLKKVQTLSVSFLQYSGSSIYSDVWAGAAKSLIKYENTDGWLYKRTMNTETNIFGLMLKKAQHKR